MVAASVAFAADNEVEYAIDDTTRIVTVEHLHERQPPCRHLGQCIIELQPRILTPRGAVINNRRICRHRSKKATDIIGIFDSQ